MFSLLIRSYNNLCWVGDPQERQNAHQAASPWWWWRTWCGQRRRSIKSAHGWHQATISLFLHLRLPVGVWNEPRGLLVTIFVISFKWAEMRLLWKSFRSHSGRGFASCYHHSAGCYTFLDVQKDQILLGCFTVWFSPSFPAVSVLILAEWGPCGIRSPECCT